MPQRANGHRAFSLPTSFGRSQSSDAVAATQEPGGFELFGLALAPRGHGGIVYYS